MTTTLMFFIGLLCFCYMIEFSHNYKNESDNLLETETKNEIINIKPVNHDFVLLHNEIKENETITEESRSEEIKIEEETKIQFEPYTFWYDYNRYSGEVIQINEQPLNTELQEYIYNLCLEHNISFAFIMAQIGAETDFRVGLESEVGAVGLMQIRGSIHYELMDYLDANDLYNPYQNVKVGINLMHLYFDEYEESNLALMVYNCGSSGAKRLWQDGVYSTSYTKEILTVSQKYEEIYGY